MVALMGFFYFGNIDFIKISILQNCIKAAVELIYSLKSKMLKEVKVYMGSLQQARPIKEEQI